MSRSRLEIWMMSTSTSRPITPVQPDTPPPSSPSVRVTLPTPPSFSSRRNRSQIINVPESHSSPPTPKESPKRGHGRSVSFSLLSSGLSDHAPDSADSVNGLYRIPQRVRPDSISPTSDTTPPSSASARRAAPRPLDLATRPIPPGPTSALSPMSRMPSTAPISRFGNAAAQKDLSISPTISRSARHSIAGPGSIWAAGLSDPKGLAGAAGWISPALASARSTGTSARPRGLTVAVLKDGSKEILVSDVPVTPGLSTGGPKSAGLVATAPLRSAAIKEETDESESSQSSGRPNSASLKQREIILCRYYHTPGLTCTSRPCRFVHNLEALGSAVPKDLDQYDMKSPNSTDPTGGTFAQAQMKAQAKSLNIDELVVNGAVPGETIILNGEDGDEVTGTVFLMSGGGKGPAGKSKAKYKTVPCKDFVEGHCPYGDYCSFIHDEKPPKWEDVPVKNESTATKKPPTLDAWTKPVPASVLGTSKNDLINLSAFAPPFLQEPVKVDETGELIKIMPPATLAPVQDENASALPIAAKVRPRVAWAKGPPPSLRPVTVAGPPRGPLRTPLSSSHLAPPVSAASMFGTESDPATPWDPAMRRAFEVESVNPEYSGSSFANPLSYPSPTEFAPQVWNMPSYPWGMPMSPIVSAGQADPMANIPGGPGVMWTPAGWAVQDAAMKHSLRATEVKTWQPKTRVRQGKTYYKTRTCKFFLEGSCPHGEACTYLHTLASDTSSEHEEKLALNVKLRTLPCKFFNSTSGCHNGGTCTFLHTFVVPTSVPLVDKPRPWRTKPCRHWQLGRCTLGDACHFAHVVDPTRKSLDADKDCRHWAKGRCEKGDACRFKHEGGMASGEEIQLTEARLAMAFEQLRGSRLREEESDGEDDDVEIVTEDTSVTTSSPRALNPVFA